ncbi:EAL domain-containing response regulator [Vibrio jasicida]|uniref:EAL domain-containing response regulator n=1 Tax=Vibrio jasicida TaxID=766224 RepID=UPI000CE2C9D8|nr:EAL domain-containing response regulator [Vibrio jasicida]
MNVLIVEDDILQATNLKILANRLVDGQVSLVHSGSKVSEVCAGGNIDLMICDIDLPDLNGINLLSTLSEEIKPKGVVILSAMSKDIVEITYNMCLSANYVFVRAMTKPISFEQLHEIVTAFQKQMQQSEVKRPQIQLNNEEIEQAFNNGWFENYYQPQYTTDDNTLVGVEALVRCHHPVHGLLAPVAFLDQINQRNELDRLFWLVLQEALRDIAHLGKAIHLSVNMNQKSLREPMSERFFALCTDYDVAPERITLELTEDEVYDSGVISLANLANLRLRGVGLAIDDFGTGYSSLSQLAVLPYTELKIDRQFISNSLSNFKSQQLTISSLQLAKSLGLKSVAEGVEDEDTLHYLNQLGVDLYQGFVASKAIPLEALKKIV